MSGLFSAIGRGLSAAGYGAGEYYGKSALMDQESALATNRAMRLAEFQESLKNAPRNRLQSLVQREAGVEVPMEASPVSSLTGAGLFGSDGKAPDSSGFSGDPKALLKEISSWKDGPDKTAALAQLRSQYGADLDANKQAVAGQTRKRTPDEAFDAAMARAKMEDLGAYEAGKPLATDKTITVADGATIIDKNGKVIYANTGKSDRALELEDRRDQRERTREDNKDRREMERLNSAERLAAIRSGQERVPVGYRWKADGSSLEYIPGGPADPTSKPAGGKPLNEGQSKALLFGARMEASNKILDKLAEDKKLFSTPGANAGYGVGAAMNVLNSAKGQQLDQAKRDFLNAVLRRESGAVISDQEFENGNQQYFPQAGDSKEVIAQKRSNRLLATRGILAEVPDAETHLAKVRGAPEAPASPTIEDLLKKYGK